MKAPKERLHRVLVIGANPAGIAATNKLGEMGIPVTLVDPDSDLNQKLASEEWRLTSGLTLNYALRPGLLRIMRNPRIKCFVPGEVSSIKHTPQGFAIRLKNLQTFVDADQCTLCGRCADECPICDSNGGKPIKYNGRRSLPGRPVIDKRRQPLCQKNCPLGVNVQGYVALTMAGKYAEALNLIRKDNVLPGICGRICTHPCELACRRSELDEPLAIRDIKRFLADYDAARAGSGELGTDSGLRTTGSSHLEVGIPIKREQIAVIGSGPAGLAAAADLARFGYSVTIYEKEQLPGGLLRYGIGPHRLPRAVLDQEIENLKNLGIQFELGHPIDLPEGLKTLKERYAAVVVATGIWKDRKLGVPGENLPGVDTCIDFLCRLYRGEIKQLQENVAVIGDGNAAFDLARALVRIGAEVTIVSWFPEDLIPADPVEVQAAREEGVRIIDRARVIAFLSREQGTRSKELGAGSSEQEEAGRKLVELKCAATEPGEPDAKGVPWPVIIPGREPFEIQFDRAFIAIGQMGDPAQFGKDDDFKTGADGLISIDTRCSTSMDGVYAAGDVATGASSVVHAMASGRLAARAIHQSVSGEDLPPHFTHRPEDREFADIPTDAPYLARARMPERQPAARMDLFAEVALGLTEPQVRAETERCLQCGVCSECLQCMEACAGAGAIRHDLLPGEMVEQAGIVIIADPDAAPAVKGEDVLRAYSAKTLKTDVYAMMLRGFAAAAEAMILLGGSSQRMKGHGLSFTPPDPQVSSELRLGVFVCRCNDSLGWSSDLDEYLQGLTELPDVQQVEVLASACTPQGSANILRIVREKALTRIVLASCVCCPLDFICSTCTDQRSRLKDALFNGTGISRSMVETCNLRGEVLPFLKMQPNIAGRRFAGLMERSIGRARNLKSMPVPARPYNFTTAVIGDSKAAIRSAMTLAEAGMEVFIFGTPEDTLSHPNIHIFAGATIRGLRGTVGNFQVIVDNNGLLQELLVGAVILGEKSRKTIPYMPTAELMPHMIESSMQKKGIAGVPFFYPGATSIPGLSLANPPGITASERVKGAAAAIMAATVMPRRPRQNKGYTVVVNESLCRGCGRCIQVCPYQAVSFRMNEVGGWCAHVDAALCKGCGNCIAVCPSNAADSPYRDRRYLEQMVEEILL